MAMHDNFVNKPINIEHNRKSIVGTILTAGFSSFGSDEPLTKEEVEETKEPFNVTLGGVIWKIADQGLWRTKLKALVIQPVRIIWVSAQAGS